MSPIGRLGLVGLRRGHGALLALVAGSDEVTGAPLLQLQHFDLDDLRPDCVFEDLVVEDCRGLRRIEASAIDRIRPIQPAA
ncbi:MAG: hypothetical protein WCI65_12360 [Synechococcaceae cyanobacterium ELA263]